MPKQPRKEPGVESLVNKINVVPFFSFLLFHEIILTFPFENPRWWRKRFFQFNISKIIVL
jgi:hypothetical protein